MEIVIATPIVKSLILGHFIYLGIGKFIEVFRGLGLMRLWAYAEIIRCLPCTTFWATLFIMDIWWAMSMFILMSFLGKLPNIKNWFNGR
jgi:hypothetical protein